MEEQLIELARYFVTLLAGGGLAGGGVHLWNKKREDSTRTELQRERPTGEVITIGVCREHRDDIKADLGAAIAAQGASFDIRLNDTNGHLKDLSKVAKATSEGVARIEGFLQGKAST